MLSDRSPLLGVRKNRFRGNNDSAVTTSSESYHVPESDASTESSHRTYPTRFWIIGLTSFTMFFHCVEWNTWGPITESVEVAYGWNTGTLALLPGWVTIMYIVSVAPICWVVHNMGLRFSMILSDVLTSIGLTLRCIPLSTKLFTMMCHLSAILLGIGTTVILSIPPMVASDWCAPGERTSAIAIMLAISQLGSIGSYLEPLLVRRPDSGVSIDDIKSDVNLLMYIGAGASWVILIATLIYFPSKPPTTPSNASDAPRISFKSSIRSLSRNVNMWVLLISYGIAIGPSIAWITTLDVSLIPLGMQQDEAMWVGVSAVVTAAVFSVIIGRITDLLFGHLKISIISLLLGAAACYYWFLLITTQFISYNKWQVYVSVSCGLALNYTSITLFLELAAEVSHPVPEVITCGIITAADNICSTVFFLIYLIPKIGYEWVVYTLIGSNAIVIIPLLFVKESYTRSKMDRPSLE